MKRILLSLCLVSSVLLLAACGKKNNDVQIDPIVVGQNTAKPETLVAQNGDTVSVMYVGTLEDGTIFDTNIIEEAKKAEIYNELRPYSALAFTVGNGNMIPGFEKGVIGMKIGESKVISVPSTEGYGDVREDMIQVIPVSRFEEAEIDRKSWEVGEKYTFDRIQGTVVEKGEDTVTIDFNHFLAGKDLTFTVSVEDITR